MSEPASAVTTHVLDAARGRPAAGVPVVLQARTGTGWRVLAEARTDADGRVRQLGPARLAAGVYRLVFDTDAYFTATATTGFYPEVSVTFRIGDPGGHHHVPVLLSPFAFSTYRGS
ncbi:hydroxyisourate hydrolase [Goodfellowiella coeruleoviolacea]|uniref:5-hydroxyisourate hydrolase n=1 Tax=Goodfellowiella coeruleoviolacea TaxID=334858 RepID=A0AAE3GDG7_9PSEU|nr:hydroxyisourate hydrolase [Goodfellowiella coeruleoviolacea]MCP2165375.1 5-hydroxyisourate hydrolase [Goodfellowiella coeruleoviolacea]